jgi:UDP-glucose 4-epimerase
MFKNKVILITGGTGSFGNALVKHFLNSELAEIRIFSRDEKKQDDMRNLYQNEKLKFIIGDVRDYNAIFDALRGVDFLFHAAALKQVPSCEFYPMEAVHTNILGANNVVKAAISQGVKSAVFLSTDKAVYPINAMGLSKAMMEKIVVSNSRNCDPQKTILCTTRYGNVMASRGSVIPLFLNQIRSGGKITITDPSMTRFLMSLDESVDLVLYAFENAISGDIFVQKSPACTIGDLAIAMSEMFHVNNEIHYIGTRHGEKLYETLISREEMVRSEEFEKYFRISADIRDLNYKKYFFEGEVEVSSAGEYTSHNTHRLDIVGIKETLCKLEIIKDALSGK